MEQYGNYQQPSNGRQPSKVLVIILIVIIVGLLCCCCGGFGIFGLIGSIGASNDDADTPEITIEHTKESKEKEDIETETDISSEIYFDDSESCFELFNDYNLKISARDFVYEETSDWIKVNFTLNVVNNSKSNIVVQYNNTVLNNEPDLIFDYDGISEHIDYDDNSDIDLEYILYSKDCDYLSDIEMSLSIVDEDLERVAYIDNLHIYVDSSDCSFDYCDGYINTDTSNSQWTEELRYGTDAVVLDIPSETDAETDTIEVGFDGYVKVDIPSDWVTFKDVDVPANDYILQYTDPSLKYIVTISKYDGYTATQLGTNLKTMCTSEGATVMQEESTNQNGVDVYSFFYLYGTEPYSGTVASYNGKAFMVALESNTDIDTEYSDYLSDILYSMNIFE